MLHQRQPLFNSIEAAFKYLHAFPEQNDMDAWWLSPNGVPKGADLIHARSLDETGEDDLVFVEETGILRGKKRGSRRVYLVRDGRGRTGTPGSVMGVIPRDPAVMNAMVQLYREMRQSFEVGDLLISSIGEKDEVIREKQRRMTASSRRYNAIIQNANDIIFIVGPSGRITFCNSTFTRCLAAGGLSPVGRKISRYMAEEDRPAIEDAVSRGFTEGAPVRMEARMPLSSGRVGILSLLFTPLKENGRTYALSVIGRDVTDLRAMQKRLAIQASDLSQMMNGLAHELRNPLTVIGAYARRLAKGSGKPSTGLDEAVSGIYSSIRRIETMIERVEGYERLVKMETSFAPVDLRALVERVIRETCGSVPVRLEAEGGIHALGDEEHVRIAFSRILENAVQTGTPEVLVGIRRDDAYAYVSVRDFGPGVRDRVQTILAPFYSTDPMKTGLGLTEARIAMVKMRGDLEVERQARPGAVFTLKLLIDGRRARRR